MKRAKKAGIVLGLFMFFDAVFLPRAVEADIADKTAATKSPQLTDNANGVGQLDEIIVTAQKREQSINRVGMAITALSGEQLKQQGIVTVSDLTKVDSSFVASNSFYSTPVYTIRGIGYNDFALAASPTVTVYQDEVPYAYLPLTKGAPLDVDRVEVLKGPQGTLFGQNATGGAVNYVAAKPTDTFQAGVEGTYGRFNATDFNGYLSGPISATLEGRLSLDITEGGAWQQSETRPGDTLGDQDLKKARLLLDWNPVDRIKLVVNLNGWTDNSDALATQEIGLVPHNTGKYPDTAFASPLLAGRTYSSIVGLIAEPFPNNDRQADWWSGAPPKNDEKYYQGSLRAEFTVSDSVLITYIGSYQNYRQNDVEDVEGLPVETNLRRQGSIDSDYQELRASGKLLNDKVDWLLGGDYSKSRTDENDLEDTTDAIAGYGLITLPVALHLSDAYLNPFSAIRNISTDDSQSEAIFGNMEFHPSETIAVHAGVRYTKTDINHSGCTQDVDGNFAAGITDIELLHHIHPVVPAVQGGCVTLGPDGTPELYQDELNQHNVSWRLGADWTPIEKTLLYATVSKGYKAGAFPTLSATSYAGLRPVTQESLLAYETGFKSRLADSRLELTGALFYYDYRNKQLEAYFPDPLGIFGVLNTLLNVPTSKEEGAELSLKLRPVAELTLAASGTYLDSAVTGNFINYNQYISSTTINLRGEPFPNTPKWSARVGAQYDRAFNAKYAAFIGMDARYQSASQGAFGNSSSIKEGFPSLEIDAYGILDLRAGLNSNDGHWHFELFGNNVTNKYYWTQVGHVFDTTVRYPGMPATFGLTVGYKY
jgi:iron complex outermembrane recepter protein